MILRNRLLRRYAGWVLAVVTIDVILWFLIAPGEAQRGDALNELLLLNTLLVVWWYAHRTEQQVGVSEAQFQLAWAQQRQLNKPLVVIDTQQSWTGTQGVTDEYWARNIGPGLALNVYISHWDRQAWFNYEAGALAAAHGKRLFGDILGHLQAGQWQKIVAAEGLVTRTAQWTVTLNVATAPGRVHHKMAQFELAEDTLSFSQFMERNGEAFRQQLDDFRCTLETKQGS